MLPVSDIAQLHIQYADPVSFIGYMFDVWCVAMCREYLDIKYDTTGRYVVCRQPCWLLVDYSVPSTPLVTSVRPPRPDGQRPVIKTLHDIVEAVYKAKKMHLVFSMLVNPPVYTHRGVLVYSDELLVGLYGSHKAWVLDRDVYARLLEIPYTDIAKTPTQIIL